MEKKKEVLSFVAIWMKLKDTGKCEISLSQEASHILYVSTYVRYLKENSEK